MTGDPFPTNLPQAARRHFCAGDQLLAAPGGREDVAAYLFGLAAECALKAIVERTSIAPQHNKTDILYAHFPELRTLIREAMSGRRAEATVKFIFHDRFMNNWHVRMRYSDGRAARGWVSDWRTDALAAISAMETT